MVPYLKHVFAIQEKVDAAANELRQNQVLYDHFLQRMDVWLQRNSHKVLTVMKRFDRDQESYVTYDEFKSGMRLYRSYISIQNVTRRIIFI